jgi:hypothetical protein
MEKLLKQYKKFEANNDHNESAMLLVKNFGTQEEIDIIEGITVRTNRKGYITNEDNLLRYKTSNKYYKLLFQTTK